MNKPIKWALLTVSIFLLLNCTDKRAASKSEIKILPPEELYGQLFYDVMSRDELFGKDKLFNDSKDFVDCIPQYEIETILEKYSRLENKSSIENISGFLKENFIIPEYESSFTDSSDINQHIFKLWSFLKKEPDIKKSGTLIPLKHPYIIPGGRFREVYYWDSYFTMLGLQVDKQDEIIQHMVDNFSDMTEAFGFIPNGNRTYYLSRSQPPFYALMLDVLSEVKSDKSIYSRYLKNLETEYAFWMEGVDKLNSTSTAYSHVVQLDEDAILNRYWDKKNIPRSEMYREDIHTANQAAKKIPGFSKEDLFRNLRSAAESGWDFSSRWLTNTSDLYTIQTTNIIPVDLNALLYHLELTISKGYLFNKDSVNAKAFKSKSENRKKALVKYCWNQEKGFFMDYNFKLKKQTEIYSLAGVYPLFFKIASKEQAKSTARKIENSFLKQGGVVTTLYKTGQQWDSPNGWAPLQWITIVGLRNYNENKLANTIKTRWLNLNKETYKNTYKMFEKYDVVEKKETGGGEYPNQDGFGWTNGVYQRLSKE